MSNQPSSANVSQLNSIAKAMTDRGFTTSVVATKEAALDKLKSLIPAGSKVMTGSSTTLNQIGFTDYLASATQPYTNLHSQINSETDEAKRNDLRRFSITADVFVASANAITTDGQIIAVDATGSRVGAYAFGAKQLILVISAQKITPDLSSAMTRIKDHVFPLEDARAQEAYGVNSAFGKWIILEREFTPNRIQVILVEESLGF